LAIWLLKGSLNRQFGLFAPSGVTVEKL